MQNELETAFVRKEVIAARLAQRAAELWGIEHPESIDPIVQLLIDVVAYELARLGSEVAVSDAKLLENLAGILVPGNWLLPRPAHAILSAQPIETGTRLGMTDQFYATLKDKSVTGEESITELFFSPLAPTALIRGKVAFKVVSNTVYQAIDRDQYVGTVSSIAAQPGFHGLWLGLEIADDITLLEQLDVYLKLPDAFLHLEPLLSLIEWRLQTGASLQASPYGLQDFQGLEDGYDGQRFALLHPERAMMAEIAATYRHRIFTLRGQGDAAMTVSKENFPPSFAATFGASNLQSFDKPLLWLQLVFPAAFTMQAIEQAHFELNCFPIVGKRLHYAQHRLHAGLNIVPLRLPASGAMFFVDSLTDDQGRMLQKRQFNAGQQAPGTYLLHQGDLERVDRTSAESYLAKMMRLVQEESSIFSAYGQDLMLKQLNNLRKDLEAIRLQLGAAASGSPQERHYLLVQPFSDSKTLEIEYWSTEQRQIGSALRLGATLLPYKQVMVQPGSARLRTTLLQAAAAPLADEKVAALRYGLLTRHRVVSKQDIKLFVRQALAGHITDVQVQNGVAITADPKGGLVRTIDILIEPAPGSLLSTIDWDHLLGGLQENLITRSVHTAKYRLRLQHSAQLPLSN